MTLPDLLLVAVGLAADAFAVSICTGLAMKNAGLKNSLIVGLYFGAFQAGMPVIGYLLGRGFADRIERIDHWVIFVILIAVGGKMILESFKKEKDDGKSARDKAAADSGRATDTAAESVSLSDSAKNIAEAISEITAKTPAEADAALLRPAKMLPLAVATSIDALAVGVTFAVSKVNITQAAVSIGTVTLILSMIGVKIGNLFGLKFKSYAELAGGAILAVIAVKTLADHIMV